MPASRAALLLALLALPVAARAQDAGAVGELGQLLALEDRKVFDEAVLERAAQHPDAVVRRYAAIALGRIGDPLAAPLLRRLLSDSDSSVKVEAAFACGLLGDRALVPDLVQLLDRFPRVVTSDFESEIVTALAKLGGPEAEQALDGLLQRHSPSLDPDDRATTTALLESFRFGRRSALARRLSGYIRGARGDWRRNATYSASRLRLAEAGAAMLEVTQDADALTRSYAARALTAATADSGGVGRETFLARLRVLVNDADAGVRINALRSLATYEDSSLAPIAIARLSDRDANVPLQAAITLGSLKGSRAAAALVERFPGASTFGLQRAMILSLAAAAPSVALETARAWHADADWRNRATFADVLGAAKSPAARQQLFEMLADQDARVVGVALNALRQVSTKGDSAVVAAARDKLASPDPVVRTTAIGILARERSAAFVRDFTAAYRRAEADALNDARLAAVGALADLADSAPGARAQIETLLFGSLARPADYLVRRLASERFGGAARAAWGAASPVETGRGPEEYRELARRYLLGVGAVASVTIEAEHGTATIQLYGADAPLTVDNFVRLVDRHYFDNGRWHRVVPNFVLQDGDSRGDGNGGPGTVIRDEINRHRYDVGTVGMALSGPDTGGSQFFICHSPQPHLDGGYTVFGQVVSGWDVLTQVVQGDRIRRIFR